MKKVKKYDHFAHMSSASNHYNSVNAKQTNNELVYKLNTRIRSLRISKGWSQSYLGKVIAEYLNLDKNIPTSTVASWEHKNIQQAKIPSPDKIEALASIFHVSIDYLKGLSENPKQNAIEYMSNQSHIENIAILAQELPQYIGQPIWVNNDKYNGWMLLCEEYCFVDSKLNKHAISDLIEVNTIFSAFPPCHVYFKQVYNRYVIPETKIRSYYDRMWVCINSPDVHLQSLNGWYIRTEDGLGVKGKTILSFDSYFDLWIAYTSPLTD